MSDCPFLRDSRATGWGCCPCVVQGLSLNHLMILGPENLLLCIIPVTFSCATHLPALTRGWYQADLMEGVLHVLGSALMCCGSFCSGHSPVRELSAGLCSATAGLFQRPLPRCSVWSCSASTRQQLQTGLLAPSLGTGRDPRDTIHPSQSTVKHLLYFSFYWLCLLSSAA